MSIRLIIPIAIAIIAVAFLLHDYYVTKNKMTDQEIKDAMQSFGIKKNNQGETS